MSHTYNRNRSRFFSRREHVAATKRSSLTLRSCHGKIAHPSKRAASGVIRDMLRVEGAIRPGYELQAYKCKLCGRWHVGNSRISRRVE